MTLYLKYNNQIKTTKIQTNNKNKQYMIDFILLLHFLFKVQQTFPNSLNFIKPIEMASDPDFNVSRWSWRKSEQDTASWLKWNRTIICNNYQNIMNVKWNDNKNKHNQNWRLMCIWMPRFHVKFIFNFLPHSETTMHKFWTSINYVLNKVYGVLVNQL